MTIDIETLDVIQGVPEAEAPPSEFPGLIAAEDGSLVVDAPPYTNAQVLEEGIKRAEPTVSSQRKKELQFGQRSYSLRELAAANIERPAELVENLLFEGDTVCLVARPKTGKTRLVQQLSVALAQGSEAEFLGLRVRRRARILCLDLESHPADYLERLQKIAGNRWDGIQDQINVYCVKSLTDSRVGLWGQELKELKLRVQEVGAEVLVIDTWRLVFFGKENEADSVVKNLRQLDELRSINPNLAIILLHHLRKGGSEDYSRTLLRLEPQVWLENAAGSHAFVAHTDAAFGLEPEGELYIFNGVRRNGPAPLLVLRSDEETLRFEPLDDLAMKAGLVFSASQSQQDLWSKLPGRFRWSDAERIAGGASKKSLTSATLKRAVENGLLTRAAEGEYVKA